MIKEQRAKEKKRKKRRKHGLITFLVLVILLGSAFLIVWKVFTVQNVVVEGNVLYEDSVISDTVLSDEYSWNSLYVLLKYKFTETKDVPFIDTVKISLDNPHTVHIEVYEKGVMGYFYESAINENVYFDKDGFVVETSSRVIENVPEIKGLSCGEIILYEKLDIERDVLSDMLTLTQALKRANLIPNSILFGAVNSPVLVYDQVWVQMGSDNLLSLKVEHLKEILPRLEGESGVLHMESWTEDSPNIIFDRDE